MISQRTPEPIDLAELDRLHDGSAWGSRQQGTCGTFATYRITPQATDRGGMREEDASCIVILHNAYPALHRVVEALQAIVKCDGNGGRLGNFLDFDYPDAVPYTAADPELTAALKSAREALSAFKLPEAE